MAEKRLYELAYDEQRALCKWIDLHRQLQEHPSNGILKDKEFKAYFELKEVRKKIAEIENK